MGFIMQGGGNGIVKVRSGIFANRANTYAIHLADANQLDLELESGETITGRIKIGTAGVDDKGTMATSDDTDRAHSIVIKEGGEITTSLDNAIALDIGDFSGGSLTVGGKITSTHSAGIAIRIRGTGASTLTLESTAEITGSLDLATSVDVIDRRLVRTLSRVSTRPETVLTDGILTIVGATLTISTGSTPAITLQGAPAHLQISSGAISTTPDNVHGVHSPSSSSGIGIDFFDGSITTSGAGAHGIFIQSGGNGRVSVNSNISATGANSYAINLADANQLNLSLTGGKTITGSVRVGTAGVDDKRTPETTDDEPREHFIDMPSATSITSSLAGVGAINVVGGLVYIQLGSISNDGTRLASGGKIESTATDGIGISIVGRVAGAEILNLGMIKGGSGGALVLSRHTSAVRVRHLLGEITATGTGAKGIFLQGGGNGVVEVKAPIDVGATGLAIDLADENQLILELGDTETITGGIKIGTAGVDDNDTPSNTADDTARTHSITIGQGASIVASGASTSAISITGAAGSVINVAGTITVTNGGRAITSTGDNAEITISGTVSATNSDNSAATALYIRGTNVTLIIADTAQITGTLDLGAGVIVDDLSLNAVCATTIATATTTALNISTANDCRLITSAGSITVSSGSAPAVTISGANVELTNRGTISSTVSAHAISITGNGAKIANQGTISTSQASAHGIHSGSGVTSVRVNHTRGTITTTGATANGIYLQGGGNGIVKVRAPISASSGTTFAIHLADTNQLDLKLGNGETITGAIQVAGAGVDDKGTMATSDDTDRTHSIVVGTGAEIVVAGASAIHSTGAGTVINIVGTITATGSGSRGIHSTGNNSQITVSGTVSVTGASNSGSFYIRGTNVTLTFEVGASITGSMDLGTGVTFIDKRAITISADTTISTAMTRPYIVAGGHLTVASAGSLMVSAATTTAPAVVRLQGVGAQLTNLGTISTSSTGTSHAVSISANDVVINNSGTISTTQANAHGIHSTDQAMGVTINHLTGTITTAGAGANGIHIQGGGNGVVQVRAPISATGANANAINLYNLNQTTNANQLDLELGSGETITGAILLGSAGVDGSNQARRHSIVVGTGATITSSMASFVGLALQGGAGDITNRGKIESTARGAGGIYIFGASGTVIENHGMIRIAGLAIDVNSTSNVTVKHLAGDITTTRGGGIRFADGVTNGVVQVRAPIDVGADNFAIRLADGNQLDLELGTGETITGYILLGTAGVDSSNNPRAHSIVIGTGAEIVVESANAIYSTGAGTVINIVGTITATGFDARGIESTGNNSEITISGTISVTGNNNDGALYIRGKNTTLTLTSTASITGDIDIGAEVTVKDARQVRTLLKSGMRAEVVAASGHLTIPSGLAVRVSLGTTPAVNLTGASARLTNSGVIETTQANVNAVQGASESAVISIAGSVIVSGAGAQAIRVTGAGSSITVSGKVEALEAATIAIYARGTTTSKTTLTLTTTAMIVGTIDIDNTVTFVDNRPASTCTNKLTATATTPLVVDSGTCYTIEHGASLTTAEDGESAVGLEQAGVVFTNRGTISAATGSGRDGSGIWVTEANIKIVNEVTGVISSAEDTGIYVDGANNVTITNYGNITSGGGTSAGIFSGSSSSGIEINHLKGVITTTGEDSIGIYVEGAGNGVVTVRSSIRAKTATATTEAIELGARNQLDLEIGKGETIEGRILVNDAGVDGDGTARGHRIVVGEGASVVVSAASTGLSTIEATVERNTVVEVYGSVKATTTTGNTFGIILPAGGDITLFNGAELSATTAIKTKAGTLTILPGAKITGTITTENTVVADLRLQASLFASAVQGTVSTRQATNAPLLKGITDYRTSITQVATTSLAAIVTTETGAATAWDAGWTGKDVRVRLAVIGENITINVFAVKLVIKSIAPELNIDAVISLPAPRDKRSGIARLTSFANSHSALSARAKARGETENYILLPALSLQRNEGGSYASDTQWQTLITDSLTATAPYMDSSKNISMATLPATTGAHDVNMLIVLPAGDDKVACNTATSSASIKDCNLVGGILAKKRETSINAGDRVLFVGALTDDDGDANTADTMASYSLEAGNELKYDFMVAHDDIYTAGDTTSSTGKTAFAAARVTGVATLLRHKFPSLDGAALKQVLIQTADDLGATGPDPIFGMGELNLGKALSPIGNMVTR